MPYIQVMKTKYKAFYFMTFNREIKFQKLLHVKNPRVFIYSISLEAQQPHTYSTRFDGFALTTSNMTPLNQNVLMPSMSLSLLKDSIDNGFVKITATCSMVWQYFSSTIFYFTWSLRKWNRVSICLLLPCCTRFFASFIVDLLSTYIVVDSSCG